jgi:hypothetical protein
MNMLVIAALLPDEWTELSRAFHFYARSIINFFYRYDPSSISPTPCFGHFYARMDE